MAKNSNNDPIHSSKLDINQLNHIIKETFLQLDKQLSNVVKDQSGSVCVRFFFLNKIFIHFQNL